MSPAHLAHAERVDGRFRVRCRCGWVDATLRRSWRAADQSMRHHIRKNLEDHHDDRDDHVT